MPKLTDRDAIDLMLKYYGKKFTAHDTALLVSALSKVEVVGLVKYAYEQGNSVNKGEKRISKSGNLYYYYYHEIGRRYIDCPPSIIVRREKGESFASIAKDFGISRQRIHQLYSKRGRELAKTHQEGNI